MKKLVKLQINPEKVMKNDELTTLRGGYDIQCQDGYYHYWCQCFSIGVWEGCYQYEWQWQDAINTYCGSYENGYCRQI